MRTPIASALLVVFGLVFFTHSVAAQSSPIPSQPQSPQQTPQKPPSSAKLLPPRPAMQIRLLANQAGSANDDTITPQELRGWIGALRDRKDRLPIVIMRSDGGPDAPNCAHIMIYPAPKMDSEMVIESLPEESGDVATLQGLPPCRRDLRAPMTAQRFYGAPPMLEVPPHRPFTLQPPASQIPAAQPRPVQPKTDAPAPKP